MKKNLEMLKPARYIGGEFNSIVKNFNKIDCQVLLALPDVYEVGMSNLGLAILYSILNRRQDTLCERVYAPWIDMEKFLREENIPLFALESKRAARDFDFLGFSLQYEMIFTNVLNMLDLAKIPIHSLDRSDDEIFVIGGGPCVYNAEPIAEFFDFFIVGEGEEIFGEVIEKFITWKNSGKSGGRKNFLKKLLKIQGIYVPSFYEPVYSGENFIGLKLLETEAPEKILKRIVKNFDATPSVEKPVVPFLEIIHDRAMLELFRGCSRGCRFCQAGMTYRPVRERSLKVLKEQARQLIDSSGWSEISLTSLSSADYSCLNRLIDDLQKIFQSEKVSISLPSLRIDSFSIDLAEKIQAVRRSGLTFAPEAGTQRLRDVINKNVTEENLFEACAAAFRKGWKNVKLYFMMGLPTETENDLRGIAELAQKVVALYKQIKKRHDVKITLSVACFVPKPFTPFQWVEQISAEEFERRQKFLKSLIHDKSIVYNWHSAKLSVLEGVLARGDRRLAKVIELAWKNGAKFDGWTDLFNFEAWSTAFEECSVNPKLFNERRRKLSEPLPWDHTSPGVSKKFLMTEWEKSQRGEITHDCRRTSCTGCEVCSNLNAKVVDNFDKKLPIESNISSVKYATISPTKYRAQIRKGIEISALSHLDYTNVFMRALIRSKLPVAWSEGFNPHLKVSFANALAVGIASDCEYVDFELSNQVDEKLVLERLNKQLPYGAEILKLKRLQKNSQSAMSLVDLSLYEIHFPLNENFSELVYNSIEKFNSEPEIKFTRISPQKTRELEIKKYLAEPIQFFKIGNEILLRLAIKIFIFGSIKPTEILKILHEQFEFPLSLSEAEINRVALLHEGKNLLEV